MADKSDKVVLPKGYKDEAAFLEEARERFSAAESYDRNNRDAATDDLKFLAGDQWDATTRLNRIAQGRPCLTINMLPQFVAQVVGDIRINRPAIKVRPAEDGDEDVAEIRQGLIRSIEQQNNASMIYAQAGTMQTACGVGYFRVGLDYASDASFNRDIIMRSVPDPLAVVCDPMSVEPTGKDMRYCFIVDERPRKEFEAEYPGVTPNSLGEQPIKGGWFQRDVVRVTEYWIVKEEDKQIHLLDDGSIVEDLPKGVKAKETRTTKRKSVCMYIITGTKVLDGPYELPITRIPVFRAEGWTLTVEGKRHRWGLVRFAKDPARLKNYWRSVSAEVLAMAPKAQWVAMNASVEGREDEFRNGHRSGDPLLIVNDGATMPQRLDPPSIPAAVLQEAALNAQDMKDVTGIHDASLGAQSNETSGRAIMARDRQGDVATYIYPDNLKEAISECGRVINELIPVVYDTARTIRILGDDESAKVQRINDPQHQDSIELSGGKYDVIVETGPSYSTKRVEAAESMMAFVQAVPGAAQIAGDLIAKAQDWPMAEQIAERLKKMMPPNIVADADSSPEEQQAIQQAAQAQQKQQGMADQMAEAELALKKAVAAKAEAEAGKAQFEVAQLGGAVDQHIQQMAGDMAAQMLFGRGQPTPEQPATAAGLPYGQ